MALAPTPSARPRPAGNELGRDPAIAGTVTLQLTSIQARELFTSAPVARLATVTPDGAPHLVPVCFALAGNDVYTAVDGKAKRTSSLARLANIAAEPRVALLADHYDDDWTRLWWVRVDGDARVVTDPDEQARGLAALAAAYRQYVERPPRGAMIAVGVRRVSGWTA
jgi:PPOX class probable F420-dependent enzyme